MDPSALESAVKAFDFPLRLLPHPQHITPKEWARTGPIESGIKHLPARRSARPSTNNQIKSSRLGKRTKIAVSRQERDSTINTALRHQSIPKACLTALLQYFRS